MEFCDNLKQLLQAYFRDFTFERLEKPWRAFAASWSRTALARHMGVNASYVTGQHCYVLVSAGVVVTLHTSTQRVLGLNLDRDTNYPEVLRNGLHP
jgi:hypothetical protein